MKSPIAKFIQLFRVSTLFATLLVLSVSVLQSNMANAWQLTAEGYGETVPLAQQNAYSALIQSIRSEVNTQVSQDIRVKDNEVSRTESKNLSIQANLLLKGVTYGNSQQQGNQYQTTAIFSLAALAQTLEYFDQSTQFDPMGISDDQIEPLFEQVLMWQAIFGIAPKSLENYDSIQINLNTRLAYLNALKTAALIKVTVLANNQAWLLIDGKPSNLDTPIALSPGVHTLTLEAENHQQKIKQVQVNPGQALVVVESLVPNSMLGKTLSVAIAPELQAFVQTDALISLMSDVGWQYSESSVYQLKIQGSVSQKVVNEFVRYQFNFDVGVYKNDEKLKKVKFKSTITLHANKDNSDRIWQQNAKKLTQAIDLLAANIQF